MNEWMNEPEWIGYDYYIGHIGFVQQERLFLLLLLLFGWSESENKTKIGRSVGSWIDGWMDG